MEAISQVQSYQCPLCKKLEIDAEAAEACFAKCDKKLKSETRKQRRLETWETKINAFRLELDDINNFPALLVHHIKKTFGAVIKVNSYYPVFQGIRRSHSTPVGISYQDRKDCYLGWEGNLAGTVLSSGRDQNNRVIHDFSDMVSSSFGRAGLVGVNTGSGNGGQKFSFRVTLFMDDFPKLKANYEAYLELLESKQAFEKQISRQDEKLCDWVGKQLNQNSSYIVAQGVIRKLESDIEKLKAQLMEYLQKRGQVSSAVDAEAQAKRDQLFPIAEKYRYDEEAFEKLKKSFGR